MVDIVESNDYIKGKRVIEYIDIEGLRMAYIVLLTRTHVFEENTSIEMCSLRAIFGMSCREFAALNSAVGSALL